MLPVGGAYDPVSHHPGGAGALRQTARFPPSPQRRHAENDDRIKVKAALEIEALHAKIDALRETEIARPLTVIESLSATA